MFSCVRQDPTQQKLRVQLQLMELEGVTLSNGVLFAKLRLLGGGRRFCQYSTRKEIKDNKVSWTEPGQPLEFTFRSRGVGVVGGGGGAQLRVSVRKEERGGRSYSKLGWAVLPLGCLGPGRTELSCILSPYSQRQRLDNSTLRLCLLLSSGLAATAAAAAATSGATPVAAAAASEAVAKTPAVAAPAVADSESAGASLGAAATAAAATAAAAASEHRRNPSEFSFASSARTHSRTNSLDQETLLLPLNSSLPSFDFLPASVERKRVAPTPSREPTSRIASTRADNFKLVREVLEQQGIRVGAADAAN